MKRRPGLLALAAGLFAVWIAYLAYLALTATHPPIVLSRPQFLVADLWLIGRLDDFDKPVQVVEVVFVRPELKHEEPPQGAQIEVSNLAKCKEEGMSAGRYILPLIREGKGYRVVAVPRSPGYGPPTPQVHIYAETPETRAQLDHLPR